MAQNPSHVIGLLYLLNAFPPEQVSRVILNLDLSEGAFHSLSETEIVRVVLREISPWTAVYENFAVAVRVPPLLVDSIRRVAGASKVG